VSGAGGRSRLFREKGFDGIGVADIMKDAGLTHGGFYAQFESKEDLAAQACARVLEASARKWDRLIETNPKRPLQAIVESYLSRSTAQSPAVAAPWPRWAPKRRAISRQCGNAFTKVCARSSPGWNRCFRSTPHAGGARRSPAWPVLWGRWC